MPITRQPQANSIYTLFLMFTKICKVGIKYSFQSPKVLKQKNFWEETKENKTKPWNKWKKQKTKPSCTVIFVGLASRQAVKYSFQDYNRPNFRVLHIVNDPISADFLYGWLNLALLEIMWNNKFHLPLGLYSKVQKIRDFFFKQRPETYLHAVCENLTESYTLLHKEKVSQRIIEIPTFKAQSFPSSFPVYRWNASCCKLPKTLLFGWGKIAWLGI